jgi:hypothetical protein
VTRALFAAALAAACCACALTDATVHPPQQLDVASGAGRGGGRNIVLVRPFRSRRGQERCGMKKNGYNSDTASVFCSRAPERMLGDLIAAQLAAAGFTVLGDPRQADPSGLVITGVVDQTFVEAKQNLFSSSFETDIALHLTAKTGAGLWAERKIYVKGNEATITGSDRDMQASFDSGVRQLVINAVAAIANLAERFPPDAPAAPAPAPAAPTPPTPVEGA